MEHLHKVLDFSACVVSATLNITSDTGHEETDLCLLFVLEDLESLPHLYPHRT